MTLMLSWNFFPKIVLLIFQEALNLGDSVSWVKHRYERRWRVVSKVFRMFTTAKTFIGCRVIKAYRNGR